MSEKVREELTTEVDAATESRETKYRWARWTAVSVAGALAVTYGLPALVRATAPDCDVVMRADDTGTQAIYLPDGRMRYGDVFSTPEGLSVLLDWKDSIKFDKEQIAERATTEYDAGNGVMVQIQVVDSDTVETSC